MPTKIEWTGETWNPTVGCAKVSSGCDNCYAIGVAHRAMQPAHEGLTIRRPGERPDWTGEVRCLPDRLEVPLRWKKPRRVFVDSMSDLFHADVPIEFIEKVFVTMAMTPRHTFQVLTKRPQRMADVVGRISGPVNAEINRRLGVRVEEHGPYVSSEDVRRLGRVIRQARHDAGLVSMAWPPPNVWLGTSIETDRYAWRARHVRNTWASVPFLSLEPLLGPLPSLDLTGIRWVIAGGESGPGARPMLPDWVTDLRDRCTAAGIPFFFKQWGAYAPLIGHLPATDEGLVAVSVDGSFEPFHRSKHGAMTRWGEPARGGHGEGIMVRGPKHRRELDGRTWDEMPASAV